MSPVRIGILGCGRLGHHLCEKIAADAAQTFELVFLWNRDSVKAAALATKYAELISVSLRGQVEGVDEPSSLRILSNLEDELKDVLNKHECDLIVEVAHPDVTKAVGAKVLASGCDYFVGSPTALADQNLWDELNAASRSKKRVSTGKSTAAAAYVGTGAFWGAEDIGKMADCGTLSSLKVTMRKHPISLKIAPELKEKLGPDPGNIKEPIVLYEGPVRGLCPLAPNNVNTMAVGAICAHNLGFDTVIGCLVADPGLPDRHVVEIDARSKLNSSAARETGDRESQEGSDELIIKTSRSNPAVIGAVTGNATLDSFWYSLLNVAHRLQGRPSHGSSFAVVC